MLWVASWFSPNECSCPEIPRIFKDGFVSLVVPNPREDVMMVRSLEQVRIAMEPPGVEPWLIEAPRTAAMQNKAN